MKHRCPSCKKCFQIPVNKLSKEYKYLPFCSKRCKLVDLGAWFDVEYKIISKPDNATNQET